ncbi:MAG TPA: transcriptional regulator, TENA/THI-4 family protein [Brevibacterium sp.]|nr:transcriptional regulator, TENA/THI-4 family protein [Brevibacterium sp.]
MNDVHTKQQANTSIRLSPDGPAAALRAETAATWDAAVGHRFVTELFAGTVDDSVMKKYLIQDYQFFESFLSMLGACVAHTDDIGPKLRFSKQLGILEADEDSYFVTAFAEVGVPEAEYDAPELTAATARFRDLMDEAVASASYPDLLVVLVIAEWLYLDWGEREDPMPHRHVHAGWIDLHRGEDFRAWVQFLVDELERVFPIGDDAESAAVRDRLTHLWRTTVGVEFAFFDEAYVSG